MAPRELLADALFRRGGQFDITRHRLRVRHMTVVAVTAALALVGVATLIVTAI